MLSCKAFCNRFRRFLFLCRQARLGSAHPCPHLFRTAGFLYAALKLVHVCIPTAFKCGVCTPPGPLCVRRRDCYGFFYRHDDIISLEFTVSSCHRCHDHACPFTSPFTSSAMGHRWHRNSWMSYIYTKLLIKTALISPLS